MLAGRTDLLELAAVVAAAGRVLCGDTGVGHLATAFGVPSVLLFGPTPPSEWGPPPERARHVVLHRGGRGDPHGATADPGLLSIGVGDVLARDAGPVSRPAPWVAAMTWDSQTRSVDASRRPRATSPTTPRCGSRAARRSARARRRSSRPAPRSAPTPRPKRSGPRAQDLT